MVDFIRNMRPLRPQTVASPATSDVSPRFWLWIDGVGGYLVCEGDAVTLGQPVPGQSVDIPILGDVSRRHAIIRRAGENYIIEPLRALQVGGRTITSPVALGHDALLDLGGGVLMKFCRPHPYSMTARLDFVSPHRTHPSTDGIVLLADACVLGPAANSHVRCRTWAKELILYRQQGGLYCRGPSELEVDGRTQRGRASLTRSSRVAGRDFSLSLEEFG